MMSSQRYNPLGADEDKLTQRVERVDEKEMQDPGEAGTRATLENLSSLSDKVSTPTM